MYKTLSGATTLGQSGSGTNDNEGVVCIPQSSGIIETTPSDCLVSYLGHSLGRSYPSAVKQSVYSTAQTTRQAYDQEKSYLVLVYDT